MKEYSKDSNIDMRQEVTYDKQLNKLKDFVKKTVIEEEMHYLKVKSNCSIINRAFIMIFTLLLIDMVVLYFNVFHTVLFVKLAIITYLTLAFISLIAIATYKAFYQSFKAEQVIQHKSLLYAGMLFDRKKYMIKDYDKLSESLFAHIIANEVDKEIYSYDESGLENIDKLFDKFYEIRKNSNN